MAKLSKKHELLPEEQYARIEKHDNEGSLMKILHTDIHRTMHVAHAVISADLKNAYTLTQPTVAKMSMRCMGVPPHIAELMLLCFQSMSFWLCTAYGVSKDPYTSTPESPFASIVH